MILSPLLVLQNVDIYYLQLASFSRWELELAYSIYRCGSSYTSFPQTYIVTSIQSTIQIRNKTEGAEPPQAPYYIPYLGNSISFLLNRMNYVQHLTYVILSLYDRLN